VFFRFSSNVRKWEPNLASSRESAIHFRMTETCKDLGSGTCETLESGTCDALESGTCEILKVGTCEVQGYAKL
jgi:hypothetical protein